MEHRQRYSKVVGMIELEKEIEKLIIDHGNPDNINEYRRKYVKDIRDEFRRIDRQFPDPLEKPLTEGWRSQIDDEYGEDGTDYRILPVENPDDWMDEEIEEYIMGEVGYPPICSPYDCTGKRFTSWTSWSRQPAGIVMKHGWGLDV